MNAEAIVGSVKVSYVQGNGLPEHYNFVRIVSRENSLEIYGKNSDQVTVCIPFCNILKYEISWRGGDHDR